MKLAVLGDLHGRDTWKRFPFNSYESGHIIFTGDYMDSFEYDPLWCLYNLANLIETTKPYNVKLLYGNHDLSYVNFLDDLQEYTRCPGFSDKVVYETKKVFMENKHRFALAWQFENILLTHAGISNTYYETQLLKIHEKYPEFNYADLLNFLYMSKYKNLFDIGKARWGWCSVGGPVWADYTELINDPIIGLKQIVGHSPMPEMWIDDNFCCVDVLHSKSEYLEVETNPFHVQKVPF